MLTYRDMMQHASIKMRYVIFSMHKIPIESPELRPFQRRR